MMLTFENESNIIRSLNKSFANTFKLHNEVVCEELFAKDNLAEKIL